MTIKSPPVKKRPLRIFKDTKNDYFVIIDGQKRKVSNLKFKKKKDKFRALQKKLIDTEKLQIPAKTKKRISKTQKKIRDLRRANIPPNLQEIVKRIKPLIKDLSMVERNNIKLKGIISPQQRARVLQDSLNIQKELNNLLENNPEIVKNRKDLVTRVRNLNRENLQKEIKITANDDGKLILDDELIRILNIRNSSRIDGNKNTVDPNSLDSNTLTSIFQDFANLSDNPSRVKRIIQTTLDDGGGFSGIGVDGSEDDSKESSLSIEEASDDEGRKSIGFIENPSDDEKELKQIQQGSGSVGDDGNIELKALFDNEIEAMMDKYPNFAGVIPRDGFNRKSDLPKIGIPMGLIFNTLEAQEKGIGHWIAVYITPDSFEIFDPLAEFELDFNFLNQIKKFITNRLKIPNLMKLKMNNIKFQDDSTETCGYHCMLFLMHRFKGIPFKSSTLFDLSGIGEDAVNKRFGYI